MAKGILYCMTTVVPGLIKIGKCGTDQFESRMYGLERNGYSNVVGLKRHFAIEVNNYDEKETLLDDIFDKSRVSNTELFALDIDLVVQLLSSFDGKQIYPDPTSESKEKIFKKATEERNIKADWRKVPDGRYYLDRIKKSFGKVKATMRVEDGLFIVEKGSVCVPTKATWMPEARKSAIIKDNILQEDVECNSPSTAGQVVLGQASNGWAVWKNDDGVLIDVYRNKKKEE